MSWKEKASRDLSRREDVPPRSIWFPLDDFDREIDGAHEITGPRHDGACLSREKGPAVDPAAGPKCLLRAPHSPRASDPPRSSKERREILGLKPRDVRLQRKLEEALSRLDKYEASFKELVAQNAVLDEKLNKCRAENEALKAENAILVDELVAPTEERLDAREAWFPRYGGNCGGSMQMRAVLGITREAERDRDKRAIKSLQRENDLLRRHLAAPGKIRPGLSNGTSKTSVGSSFKSLEDLAIGSSHHSNQDSTPASSSHSIQEFKSAILGDDRIDEGGYIDPTSNSLIVERATGGTVPIEKCEENECAPSEGASSSELFAGFLAPGETDTRRSRRVAHGRLCRSVAGGMASSLNSQLGSSRSENSFIDGLISVEVSRGRNPVETSEGGSVAARSKTPFVNLLKYLAEDGPRHSSEEPLVDFAERPMRLETHFAERSTRGL